MSLPRVAMVASALAVLLQAGCGGRTTRPAVTDVGLSLNISPAVGTPSPPVVADARVRNTGSARVWHCEGCGCGNGVGVTVLGPDGVAVWLHDPRALLPACPDGAVPLEPGGDLGGRLVFTGTLYVAGHPTFPSPTYPAPPGMYTVIARFSYSTSVPGEWIPLESRATFAWMR